MKLIKIRKDGQCAPCDFVEQMLLSENIQVDEELKFLEPGVDARIDNLLEQINVMKVPVVLVADDEDKVLAHAVGMNFTEILSVVKLYNEYK